MKKILVVEIKDNRTIITLNNIVNGNDNLLLHKIYDSKPLANNINYDFSIIDKIKNDIFKVTNFEEIDEIGLLVNTKRVIVQTFDLEFKYNTSFKIEEKNLKTKFKEKYPQLRVLDVNFTKVDNFLTKKDVKATVEFVDKDYIREIIDQFKLKGIVFTKIIPLLKAIKNSTKLQALKNGITFSVLVEEKFMQLTTMHNNTITSVTRWNTGLTDIYEHISNMMIINKSSSKKMFKSFGSIPPEDVVDDKVIHTDKKNREVQVFTKKDLSRYITEKVNELFANIKSQVDLLKIDNTRIVFNGEIKSLTGFKKYAANAFDEPNIKNFKTDLIGLSNETEFITIGVMNEIKKDININVSNKNQETVKISFFNKILRMYNYI